MPVYVDPLMNHGWKLGPSCHMWADTDEELLLMAAKIGLKPQWIQRPEKRKGCSRPFTHFDLTAGKHRLAIAKGVIQLTAREAVILWRKMDIISDRLEKMYLEADDEEVPKTLSQKTDVWIPEKEEERLKKERETFDFASYCVPERVDNDVFADKPTTRVNKYRFPFDVDITRRGKYGNQFIIGRDGDRTTVVRLFREYLKRNPWFVEKARAALQGKVLGCVCEEDEECHGDVWIEFLDRVPLERLYSGARPAAFLDFRCTKCRKRFGSANQAVIECPHCHHRLSGADRAALDDFIAALGVSALKKAPSPAPGAKKPLKPAPGVQLRRKNA